jgi:hypothetical protein
MMIGITYGVVRTSGGKEHVEEFICLGWPLRNEQKVRSEISYSAAPGGEHQWGFDIAPESLKLVWTKLELDQQERRDELEMILKAIDRMGNLDPERIPEADRFPSYAAKDPVDIVAEYLTQVREYVRDHPPVDFPSSFLSTVPIDLVVAVPVVSDAVHQKSELAHLSIRIGQTKPRIGHSAPSTRLVSINRTFQGFKTSFW